MATIEFRFNIMTSDHGGRVLIPGCEPSSTVSSYTMEAQMVKYGICKGAVANVDDILAAIPGSRIEFIMNSGQPGTRRYLVLPPIDQTCCTDKPDYYAIIKELGNEVEGEELNAILGDCDAFAAKCSNLQPGQQWRWQQ